MPPEPCFGHRLALAFGRMDSRDFGQYVAARAMFLALQIAIAHECHRFALQRVDAVQDIVLRLNLCEYDVSDLQVCMMDKCHVVHTAFDIRAHTHTGRREYNLLAVGYQTCNLRDKYLVGQLHLIVWLRSRVALRLCPAGIAVSSLVR